MKFHRVAAVAIALFTLAFVGTADAGKIKAFKAEAKEIAKTTGGVRLRYRVVVVVEDDSIANEVDRVEVTMAPVGDAPPPVTPTVTLPLKVVKANGNKRFVNSHLAFAGDAVGASYVLSATMRGPDGAAVGDTVTSTVQIGDGGPTPRPPPRSASSPRPASGSGWRSRATTSKRSRAPT